MLLFLNKYIDQIAVKYTTRKMNKEREDALEEARSLGGGGGLKQTHILLDRSLQIL